MNGGMEIEIEIEIGSSHVVEYEIEIDVCVRVGCENWSENDGEMGTFEIGRSHRSHFRKHQARRGSPVPRS